MTPRRIHLVGIGGAGMSGLARLAAEAGYRVTGTDRDDSSVLADLRAAGIGATSGHRADLLPVDAEALVVSTAIDEDNPELVAARARGLPVLHRADLLAELMSGRRGLAVAGAHGKSTTSGMLWTALGDTSACIGATIPGGAGTGAIWGDGPWFVVEADESDRSLLRLAPEAAIVLNVDHDHHSTYSSLTEVTDVFRTFVAALPAHGMLVVGDDPNTHEVGAAAACPVIVVGEREGCTVRVITGDRDGSLVMAGGRQIPLALAVPGRHNQTNAACAIALAAWCGVDPELAAERLRTFPGVGRRYERRGEAGGVVVVDDYAHHPAEIAATLAAARTRHPGRIVVVFQPHLYSRTRALRDELAASLAPADRIVVTEVYAAREPHDPSISGADIVKRIPGDIARFTPTLASAAELLVPDLRPGDLVLTLGAGDITTLGEDLLSRLQRRSGDGGDTHGSNPPRTSSERPD
jgi:UDP-N-acetylmuramate--alanine ligase